MFKTCPPETPPALNTVTVVFALIFLALIHTESGLDG